MSSRLLSLSAACLLASSAGLVHAADDAEAEKAVALLDARCFKCHSHAAGKNKGGLVMDSLAGLTTGGDGGMAVALEATLVQQGHGLLRQVVGSGRKGGAGRGQ